MTPAKDKLTLVFYDPLDRLSADKFHCLSNGGRKIDIPLLAVFSLDELHFGRKSHGHPPAVVFKALVV